MRKCVSLLFVGLILTVLAAYDQSSVSSEPPEDMILIPRWGVHYGNGF